VTRLRSLTALAGRLAALPFVSPQANRIGSSYAVTVITPILPGEADALRTVLQGFKPRDESPLAKVDHVQFARWVVIGHLRTRWRGAPRRPSTLESEYLLFSADLTAPADKATGLPGTFFRDMARKIPKECADVWGKCRDFPGVDETNFEKYLVHSLVDVGLYYAAFPDATPDEIRNALETHAKLAKFAIAHQNDAARARRLPASEARSTARQTLKDAYLAEF